MTHTGEWQRPPCALCAAPIEATARADDAPVFLRESRRWAHWACWRRARRPRRMCKVDTRQREISYNHDVEAKG